MDVGSSEIACDSLDKRSKGDSSHDQSISDVDRAKLTLMRSLVEEADPSSKVTDDATLWRFLCARELNVQKASALYMKHRKWRQTSVPLGYIPEEMIANELKKNMVCMQGFDKKGRPIAVVILARHTPFRRGLEEFKRFFVYSFDKMSASTSRGQETFSIIADFNGWAYKNVDIRGALEVLDILQDHYPERLGKLYMIHLPFIFWSVWKILYPFIDKVTKSKIMLVDNKDLEETLLNDIDEDQLPEIYGGKVRLIPIQDSAVPNWPLT